MRNTVKVIVIGVGLSLATAISTAMSQPATKDDIKALRDEIIENFRKQNEYISKQDQRIIRVERAIEDIRGEDRSRSRLLRQDELFTYTVTTNIIGAPHPGGGEADSLRQH